MSPRSRPFVDALGARAVDPPRRKAVDQRCSALLFCASLTGITFVLCEFAPPREMAFLLQVLGHHGGNVEPSVNGLVGARTPTTGITTDEIEPRERGTGIGFALAHLTDDLGQTHRLTARTRHRGVSCHP